MNMQRIKQTDLPAITSLKKAHTLRNAMGWKSKRKDVFSWNKASKKPSRGHCIPQPVRPYGANITVVSVHSEYPHSLGN